MTVVVARSLTRSEFGAFSLAFASYLFVVGLSRALSTEPFAIQFSARPGSEQRHAAESATGVALAAGLGAALILLVIGLAARGLAGSSIIAIAIWMPLLTLQDSYRFAFITAGRPAMAVVNDSVWALLQLLAIGTAMLLSEPSAPVMISAWGIAGGISALLGIWQAGTRPRPSRLLDWLRVHRELAPRYLADFIAGYGASQVILFGLAAIVGVAAVAGLRGAQALLGPINLLFIGALAAAVPEAVRIKQHSLNRLRRAMTVVSVTLAAIATAGAVVATRFPDGLGRALLGDTWRSAHSVLLPLGLTIAGNGAITGANAGLRALANARVGLRARLLSAPITAGAALAGAALDGLRGAAWGLAAGVWIGAAIWWFGFRAGLESAARPSTPQDEQRISRRGRSETTLDEMDRPVPRTAEIN